MAMITAEESLEANGPCYIVDANGDIILGSVVRADLETGHYCVAHIDDTGRFIWPLSIDWCVAPPPLRLVPAAEWRPA